MFNTPPYSVRSLNEVIVVVVATAARDHIHFGREIYVICVWSSVGGTNAVVPHGPRTSETQIEAGETGRGARFYDARSHITNMFRTKRNVRAQLAKLNTNITLINNKRN